MAGNFGFKTTLVRHVFPFPRAGRKAFMQSSLVVTVLQVHDACAAFQFKDSEGVISAETMHRIGLAEIRDEFAAVKSTADVIKTL